MDRLIFCALSMVNYDIPSKIRNLKLIIRKHQTIQIGEHSIKKLAWQFFKSVRNHKRWIKVRNCSRWKETKETCWLNVLCDLGLDPCSGEKSVKRHCWGKWPHLNVGCGLNFYFDSYCDYVRECLCSLQTHFVIFRGKGTQCLQLTFRCTHTTHTHVIHTHAQERDRESKWSRM